MVKTPQTKLAVLETMNISTMRAVANLVPSAVEALSDVLNDPDAKHGERLKAAKLVLEYAVGRPPEAKLAAPDPEPVTTDVEITDYIEEYGEEKLQDIIEKKYAKG